MRKQNNRTNLNMKKREEIQKVYNSKSSKIYNEIPEPFNLAEPDPKHRMLGLINFWFTSKELWFEEDITIQNMIKKIRDFENDLWKKSKLDFSKELDECVEIANNLINEIREEFNLNK